MYICYVVIYIYILKSHQTSSTSSHQPCSSRVELALGLGGSSNASESSRHPSVWTGGLGEFGHCRGQLCGHSAWRMGWCGKVVVGWKDCRKSWKVKEDCGSDANMMKNENLGDILLTSKLSSVGLLLPSESCHPLWATARWFWRQEPLIWNLDGNQNWGGALRQPLKQAASENCWIWIWCKSVAPCCSI